MNETWDDTWAWLRSIERSGDAVGEGEQGFWFTHRRLPVALHRNVRPARYDMEMQMEDGLTAGLAVQLNDQEALRCERLDHGPGGASGGYGHPSEHVRLHV